MDQSFREALLPALDAIDRVVHELDLAPTAVDIVTRRWSGAELHQGTSGEETLHLPRWTIVEEISNHEVMQSGGRFEMGDLRVGPIRPKFEGSACMPYPGGFTVEELAPTAKDESTEIFYRVRQEHGLGTGWSGYYSLRALIRDDPLEFYLIIRRQMEPGKEGPMAP
jgi:hypothetical protein